MSPGTDLARHTAPSIKIDGSLIDSRLLDDLLDMRVVRGMRTTGRATLTFVDRTFGLAKAQIKLGAEVEIASIEPAGVVFTGTVTAVATEVDKEGARATITAHDKTYAMARKRSVATFTTQKPSDVLRSIASAEGLQAELPTDPADVGDWLWRADSLLGQVDELCERLGWEWTLEGTKLRCVSIADLQVPTSACTLEFGDQLVRFSAEQSRPVDAEITVRGWDTAGKRAVVGKAPTPAENGGFSVSKPGSTGTKAPALVSQRAARTQSEASMLAKSLAAATATVTARGRAYFSPLVKPGAGVTIKGAGPSDGVYYVREVEHLYDGGALRTSFVAGFRPPTLLTDPWLARRPTSSILASGVHSGVVTNIKDPEKLGRVRVKLPAASEEHELDWARVVSPGGGPERGFQWLPEVNDEVLVAFEDGDTRRPVVVGGLYSKIDKPPLVEEQGSTVKKRTLVSRRGHKIEFGDGDGTETDDYIDVQLQGGKVRLRLGKDRIDLETNDKPLRIASGKSEIVFDGSGAITIKATSIKLDAQQDVEIEGANVKAKGKSQMNLEATNVTVKASAALKLQSSGVAELAGQIVKIN